MIFLLLKTPLLAFANSLISNKVDLKIQEY
jgi:hypothetical protein